MAYEISKQYDPQAVGEWMLTTRKELCGPFVNDIPFSQIADGIPWAIMPEVDKGASLCQVTVAEYRRELEEREDIYAKAALRDIDAGTGVRGYDEAGN